MDLAVRCSRKAVKLNHSLTHSLTSRQPRALLNSKSEQHSCFHTVIVCSLIIDYNILVLIHIRPPIRHDLNTLRPRQNGYHVADDIFKCIFLNENIWIPTKISLNYVRYGLIVNIAALVQIMAWHWPGDKPLSEPMMGTFGDAYMCLSASMC